MRTRAGGPPECGQHAPGEATRTCVGVHEVFAVPVAQVEEKAGLVQMHELRVVVDAVEHLWVRRLGERRVKVHCLGLARVRGQANMHGVGGLVVVQHLAEGVAIGGGREPKLGVLLLGGGGTRRHRPRSAPGGSQIGVEEVGGGWTSSMTRCGVR